MSKVSKEKTAPYHTSIFLQTISPTVRPLPTQSLTLEHFLLEGFTPFDVYAAPSRSRGRENIQLLRDFDEKLLTPHPCEYLRLEDERLVRLDGETEKWWKEKKSK
jgi:hypothetical protein